MYKPPKPHTDRLLCACSDRVNNRRCDRLFARLLHLYVLFPSTARSELQDPRRKAAAAAAASAAADVGRIAATNTDQRQCNKQWRRLRGGTACFIASVTAAPVWMRAVIRADLPLLLLLLPTPRQQLLRHLHAIKNDVTTPPTDSHSQQATRAIAWIKQKIAGRKRTLKEHRRGGAARGKVRECSAVRRFYPRSDASGDVIQPVRAEVRVFWPPWISIHDV